MAKLQNKMSEKYLLETLDRIARNSFGYAVLYVSVSKLKPKNRHPEFVKIFAKLFDSVVGSARGQFFILSNGDFVILARDITPDMVENAVEKLRQGDFDDELLTVSQTMIRSSLKAGNDVMNSIVALQYQNDLLGRDYTSDTIISLVDQVSREDVIAMARRLEHRLTCIVGRKEDADEDDQK